MEIEIHLTPATNLVVTAYPNGYRARTGGLKEQDLPRLPLFIQKNLPNNYHLVPKFAVAEMRLQNN